MHVYNISDINFLIVNIDLYMYATVHDGDYWRLLTPGQYIVTAYHEGYQPLSHRVNVYNRPHHEAQRVDFHLRPLSHLVRKYLALN